METDFPDKLRKTPEEWAKLRSAPTAEAYEQLHTPYSPLKPGEHSPPMRELWQHAMRRYSRYSVRAPRPCLLALSPRLFSCQGYAFAAVCVVGLSVGVVGRSLKKEKPDKVATS